MSDGTNVQKNKLTKEQRKLIYDALATNIVRLQEYRLDLNQIKTDGAVLFEYLCFNSFRLFVEESTSNGYFYHSYERINKEYGIGKDRVKVIMAYLKEKGVIETKVCGFPKNTHYRVRFDNLAKVEVLTSLFRTTPTRTKEIAAHYDAIAKVVNLRIETPQESLEKQYPGEMSWFNHFKKIFYHEQAKFNRTVPSGAAIKKVQPKPREDTLRNINTSTYLVYHTYEGKDRTEQEIEEQQRDFINGFRLYCAIYFLFTCSQTSTNRELIDLAEKDFASTLINYAPGIRDPIAYFFAPHDIGFNMIMTDMVDGGRTMDLTIGYFSS